MKLRRSLARGISSGMATAKNSVKVINGVFRDWEARTWLMESIFDAMSVKYGLREPVRFAFLSFQ